ncbi:MAG: FHA domain-containing protein [Ahniella sp.]|nr:FHA domain-containing protein [Ahniella sp.]
MRLHFPDGEHADVVLSEGQTSVGSTSDNRIVINKGGVQARHALLMLDARGLVLSVQPDGVGWTHVNGRPVRELAIIRPGDAVSFGAVSGLIKPLTDKHVTGNKPPDASEAKTEDTADPRYRNVPPRAVLRGVAGPHFGKIVPVSGRLVIGRGSDADLVLDEPEMSRTHAALDVSAEGLYLRDLESANGTLVNGVAVRDTCLYTGDQLVFDRNRFLVEAPGMPARPRADATGARAPVEVTQTMQQIRIDPQQLGAPALPAEDTKGSPAASSGSSIPPWLLMVIGATLVVIAVLAFNSR